MELRKSKTNSSNISESMENLQTTPTASPSAAGIPQLQFFWLQYVQGSLSDSGGALLWDAVIWDLCSSWRNVVFQDIELLFFLENTCTHTDTLHFVWYFQQI